MAVNYENLQLIAESENENRLQAENDEFRRQIGELENIIRELKGWDK